MRRVIQPHLGSALRFSQPLSGFLASPSFAALFRAATVPGILPSESSPRRDRAPLSRPPAPLRLSTSALERHLANLVTVGFIDAHAHAQLPDSPDDYGLSFSAPERTPPDRPGSTRRNTLRSASFTRFKALIPLRVRSRRLELPRSDGRSSLGFLPL
jgi:hypothetical protein